ncbi:MAG: sigma-54-dependent transcriptional regulator [Calditrichaceae bacterium]
MKDSQHKILVIEDNAVWQQSYRKWLGTGYVFEFAADISSAEEAYISFLPDIVLLDLSLPQAKQGLTILDFIIGRGRDSKVIVITSSQDHQDALEAQKRGAYAYFFKGENIEDELPFLVKRATKMQILERENRELRRKLTGTLQYEGIVAVSKQMQSILQLVEQIRNTNEPVLITGESGVGKEIIAKHIHKRSRISRRPFVAINSAALPENLLENELFGHERGAFTGANELKKGQFEQINGGTLFLDEIGELPQSMQAKILRVLQEKKFFRLGGTKEMVADFRLIAATNSNLSEEVKRKNFREDLYYRLNVIPIHIPPLRERPDDIPALVNHFTGYYCKMNRLPVPKLDAALVAYLSKLEWKGNIRQLENTLIRMLVLNLKVLGIKDIPQDIQNEVNPIIQNALVNKYSLEQLTNMYANLVYEYSGKNKKAACEFLQINYRTLMTRLRKS